MLARFSICVQAGRVTCGGNNPLQSCSLAKVIYSEKDLPESCAQQVFASLPRYHAPMIWFRASSNYTNRCFLLSIPAMVVTPRWNRLNCLGTSTLAGALPSWPITIGYPNWFHHFGHPPTAISSPPPPPIYSSHPITSSLCVNH